MAVEYAIAGSSVDGGAITTTIPAGTDYAAIMVTMYEDVAGGGTPSIPGGATATLVSTASFFRGSNVHVITGLSAGSATFTPPATGGNQWTVLLVATGVDQTTPVGDVRDGTTGAAGMWAASASVPNVEINTPVDGDLAVLILGSPTGPVAGGDIDGSILRVESGTSDYGGTGAISTRARAGATTVVSMDAALGNYGVALRLNAAEEAGPTTTTTSGPTTTTTTAAPPISAVAERGGASTKTSSTTFSLSPTANIPIGSLLVVDVATDNLGTTHNVETNDHTISSSPANTWTKIREHNRGNGINNGITVSLYATIVTSEITTSDSITLTISSAVSAKVIAARQFSFNSGWSADLSTIQSGAFAAATTTPAASTPSLTEDEWLLLGVVGRELWAEAYTQPTDWTDRTAYASSGSTAATNVNIIRGDRLLISGSGVQTYNPTLPLTRDTVTIIAAIPLSFTEPTTTTTTIAPVTADVSSSLAGFTSEVSASMSEPSGDIEFAVAGSSVGGGAINVTIPAGSNHAAIMTWMYEDGGSGAAPTVPSGSVSELIGEPTFDRAGRSYIITNLSAGSATFTPPATGGNQWCVVTVFSGVNQDTPITTPVVSGTSGEAYGATENPNLDVSTPGDNDLAILVIGSPVDNLAGTGISGSVVHISSSASDYGGTGVVLSKPRTASTTNIEFDTAQFPYVFGFGLVAAAAPSTTTTTTTTIAPVSGDVTSSLSGIQSFVTSSQTFTEVSASVSSSLSGIQSFVTASQTFNEVSASFTSSLVGVESFVTSSQTFAEVSASVSSSISGVQSLVTSSQTFNEVSASVSSSLIGIESFVTSSQTFAEVSASVSSSLSGVQSFTTSSQTFNEVSASFTSSLTGVQSFVTSSQIFTEVSASVSSSLSGIQSFVSASQTFTEVSASVSSSSISGIESFATASQTFTEVSASVSSSLTGIASFATASQTFGSASANISSSISGIESFVTSSQTFTEVSASVSSSLTGIQSFVTASQIFTEVSASVSSSLVGVQSFVTSSQIFTEVSASVTSSISGVETSVTASQTFTEVSASVSSSLAGIQSSITSSQAFSEVSASVSSSISGVQSFVTSSQIFNEVSASFTSSLTGVQSQTSASFEAPVTTTTTLSPPTEGNDFLLSVAEGVTFQMGQTVTGSQFIIIK